MKKLLFLATLAGSFSVVSFAEGIERTLRQIGPGAFLAAGTGGLILLLGFLLTYIAVSYGIYLLAKKYEPSVHPLWSWIPVFNIYPIVKVSGQPLWWIAVLIIGGMVPVLGPIITLASAIFIYHKISERTGRSYGTTALLVFFSVIMLPWLGLTVNKKDTKIAWILGILAVILIFIGGGIAGVGALKGALRLDRSHDFMNKTRNEMMEEIQRNPAMREQLHDLQNKMLDKTVAPTPGTTTKAE